MPTHLVLWLTAQLDTDERIARAATAGPWLVDCETHAEALIAGDATTVIAGGRWEGEASAFESTEDAIHIAEHDPARVLREIDAKREMLSRYEAMAAGVLVMIGVESILAEYRRVILPNLALPYADRPGYQESWRP